VALNRERSAFLAGEVDRVALLRRELRGSERTTALAIAAWLPSDELRLLLPELVYLASFSHGGTSPARELILSLPRDLVLRQIEALTEPLLRDGTYDEYRRFLELYQLLDRDLMLSLARRAAAHEDPDIREAGEDFLAGA
jgi:hypothetical protein